MDSRDLAWQLLFPVSHLPNQCFYFLIYSLKQAYIILSSNKKWIPFLYYIHFPGNLSIHKWFLLYTNHWIWSTVNGVKTMDLHAWYDWFVTSIYILQKCSEITREVEALVSVHKENVFISFPSLWENPWNTQLKWRKVCFTNSFRGFALQCLCLVALGLWQKGVEAVAWIGD